MLFKESIFQVMELLFNKPNFSFHTRGIAKITGLSTTAIVKAVEELRQLGVVKVERTAITTNIKANLEADSYPAYKRLYNLYQLERCNLVKTLKIAYRAKNIVLFGSFAKGEDIEESDVDILILTDRKEVEISNNLAECEKRLNRRINIQILDSLKNSSSEFKNALANGIILYGYVKIL